ncbi:MAG: dimethylsulfonioproprionate lyase family protein [Pseudomonadota bacterium]
MEAQESAMPAENDGPGPVGPALQLVADTTAQPIVPQEPSKLAELPDWGYLLREFYEMYRNSGAGGSEAIRRHQRRVREAISRTMTSNPRILPRKREDKPVTRHLKRALDEGRLERTAPFIRAIESVVADLSWLYGYDKVPRGLKDRFAWAEFAGPSGPVETSEVILGIVLFAPGCTYPAHAHNGIHESYFVLSGSVSENDDGVFAPGSMIFNPPGRRHRITVGDREPALLAYAWSGTEESLAGQKLKFTRPKAAAT